MDSCLTGYKMCKETGLNVFTNALDAFEFTVSHNFSSSMDLTKMNYTEKVKLCRWMNGKLCHNTNETLRPSFKNVVIEHC